MLDTVRAATGEHAEQLGLGEGEAEIGVARSRVREWTNDLGVYEVNDTDGTINVRVS